MYRISDLLAEFAALWPHAFKGETGDARAQLYRRVLGNVPSDQLQTAVERCLGDWTKSGPPMPGDIKQHISRETKTAVGEWKPGDGNWAENLLSRSQQITDKKMRDHAHLHALARREGWFIDLLVHIRDLAWMVAQFEGKASDPVAKANDWLARGDHSEWVTFEDIVMFRCRFKWRENHNAGQSREPVRKQAVVAETQEIMDELMAS